MALRITKKTECFFNKFAWVFQLTSHSCFPFMTIVMGTEPKGIVFSYYDGNHLLTVRARYGVTYIFPLVDTLHKAWLVTASQYSLTCHFFEANHALQIFSSSYFLFCSANVWVCVCPVDV